MSVSDGSAASASVFNSAFVSKVTDSTIVSKLGLNRSGSGSAIADTQQQININKDDIATLQASTRFSNFSATTDPTVTDDSASSYVIGSKWVNTVSDAVFIATDVSVGAAIWKRLDAPNAVQSYANDAAFEALYTPANGNYYYNSTDHTLRYYINSAWREVSIFEA